MNHNIEFYLSTSSDDEENYIGVIGESINQDLVDVIQQRFDDFQRMKELLIDVIEVAGGATRWDVRCDEALEMIKELGHEI